MIRIDNVHKRFGQSHETQEVLGGICFELQPGCCTALFGPNGCGKTTLINCIAGLDEPTSGSILGVDAARLGYVFQDYRRSLLPWSSVRENILFPLQLRKVPAKEQQQRLDRLLSLSQITLDLKQSVYTLSGGQAQATCILRALIVDPTLLILDEPFAALDYELTLNLREFVLTLLEKLRVTVLLISHDLEEAVLLGHRIVFLTRKPTTVYAIEEIPLAHPRSLDTMTTEVFHNLKTRAFELFRASLLTAPNQTSSLAGR